MKYIYKEYGPTSRPVIPVTLKYGKHFYDAAALVDSGADICMFNIEIAEALGIRLSTLNQHTIGGLSGMQSETYMHAVTIKVGDQEYKTKIGFMKNVSGVFNYGIVGQRGFFDHFDVCFSFKNKGITLTPTK